MLDIEWLLKNGPCRQITAKQRIICSGEMFILLTGKISIYAINAQTGLTLKGRVSPGECFGKYEFCFGDMGMVYVADTDSVVFALSDDAFCNLAQARPQMLLEIMRPARKPAQNASASARAAGGPENRPSAKTAPADAPAAVSQTAPAAQITAEGLFPDGHRSYPGIIRPEYGRLVFKKEYSCTFCGKTFEDYKVFQSKLYTAAPPRYDLRKYYSEFQTEWFDILTCPHCYFSAYYTCFSEPSPFKKADIEKELTAARQMVKLDFNAERDIDYVFAAHYLALLCAHGYVASSERQYRAKIWGNLSWLYEDVENEQMARFAAGKAAEAYEDLYLNSRLNPIQEQVVSLTIAGMMYRAGGGGNLKKYLFAAKTHQMGNKVYANMAEDLLDIINERES